MLSASIVVNNHNYDRFVGEAIESALAQTHHRTEVIVVDDGSTDRSREVIAGFGGQVLQIFQDNQGQTAALRAGFETASGDVVCFLDADDVLAPTAIEEACAEFERSGAVCVYWPVWLIDAERHAKHQRRVLPGGPMPAGDCLEGLLRHGPGSTLHPPTSGCAWRRDFLCRCFPISGLESELGVGSASADAYLAALAPLYGPIGTLDEPRASYRLHRGSDFTARPFSERLRRDIVTFRHRCRAVVTHCRQLGLEVDTSRWAEASWICQLAQAVDELERHIPGGHSFVLIDETQWGMDAWRDRLAIPFLERDGLYWGAPSDDAEAVRELERLREAGAGFLVVAWPAFWWLDHYRTFSAHLHSRFHRLHASETLIIFDLRREGRIACGPTKAGVAA